MRAPDTFKAATWNVFYGTDPEELRPILRRLRRDGVTLFLFQEISKPAVRRMIEEEGLRLYFHPRQYGIAYDPDVWVGIGAEGLRLSETHYRGAAIPEQHSEAVHAILSDRAGRTLDVVSYHTPAGVQRGGPSTKVPRRVQALRESIAFLGTLAKRAKTTAVLYGGDDNVDEKRGWGWAFMLRAATGLVQHQAPGGTHGKGKHKPSGRKIDDFRTLRLKRVGKGSTHKGGGDHAVYVQTFRWA